ncbi:MAG: NFACT RNA binding domain-containing protein [Candidatus Altiarchaeota archaeon]
MEVVLDLRKSVSENAQEYYSKAKKSRRKVAGARKALEDTKRKISALEKKQEKILEEKTEPGLKRKEIRKTEWFEKFRWFHSSDGFLVVGGKDATSNEILVKKHIDPSDTVFHAEIQGAPFFAIKNPKGVEVPESTLTEAAQGAVSYSKAWPSGMGAADAYWVTPEQVSKSAPSGEYLTKGAFMIRGKKNFFRRTPLKVAIGIKFDERALPIVLGGPISSIKKNTDAHVVIEPGNVKSGQLAKEIRVAFIKKSKKELLETIKKIPPQEIQQWIPGGKGRISKD